MAIIEAANLSKYYEPLRKGVFGWRQILKEIRGPQQTLLALKKVNLKIKKGELFRSLGSNGAGKTMFCKIMKALVIPTEGHLFVSGLDSITLSSGLKQKVYLGLALIVQPSIVVLDEPTLHLEVPSKRMVHRIIQEELYRNLKGFFKILDVIEVKSREVDSTLIENLDKIPCTKKTQLIGGSAQLLRLCFNGKEKHAAEIIDCPVTNAEIVNLRLKEPTLEDVFVSVLEGDNHASH